MRIAVIVLLLASVGCESQEPYPTQTKVSVGVSVYTVEYEGIKYHVFEDKVSGVFAIPVERIPHGEQIPLEKLP